MKSGGFRSLALCDPLRQYPSHHNHGKNSMKTVTLKINDTINEKFAWLLEHFSTDEIRILDQDEYVDDDTYLRNIDGMVKSIQEARQEPVESAVTLEQLEW
jgi:hypothetical protein